MMIYVRDRVENIVEKEKMLVTKTFSLFHGVVKAFYIMALNVW